MAVWVFWFGTGGLLAVTGVACAIHAVVRHRRQAVRPKNMIRNRRRPPPEWKLARVRRTNVLRLHPLPLSPSQPTSAVGPAVTFRIVLVREVEPGRRPCRGPRGSVPNGRSPTHQSEDCSCTVPRSAPASKRSKVAAFTVVLGFDGGRLASVVARDGQQTDDLTLTVQAGNKLTVTKGSNVRGTFPVAKKLSISLGDNDGGFLNRLDLNNRTLMADVSVRLGDTNGLDQFRLTTPSGGAGTLKGNFSFHGGDTGGEFLIFGERGDQTAVRTINVTGSVTADMGGGGDDPNSSDPNAGPPDAVATGGNGPTNAVLNVGGNMTVANSTVLALAGRVGGSLTSDSSAKPVGQLVILGNFSKPFTVGGNLTVKTGSANDDVEFQAISVNGNASFDRLRRQQGPGHERRGPDGDGPDPAEGRGDNRPGPRRRHARRCERPGVGPRDHRHGRGR